MATDYSVTVCFHRGGPTHHHGLSLDEAMRMVESAKWDDGDSFWKVSRVIIEARPPLLTETDKAKLDELLKPY
jgi:hypothetical protein